MPKTPKATKAADLPKDLAKAIQDNASRYYTALSGVPDADIDTVYETIGNEIGRHEESREVKGLGGARIYRALDGGVVGPTGGAA